MMNSYTPKKISALMPSTSQEVSLTVSQGQTGKELSIYNDPPASPADILNALEKLKAAFPKMTDPISDVLSERIVANGFSRKRLNDAVNNVIDNFPYKEFNVSDIIKFDKKVKLYTYHEVCNMVSASLAAFRDFEVREIGGINYRVRKTDLID